MPNCACLHSVVWEILKERETIMNVMFLLLAVSVSLTDSEAPVVTDGTLFVPYGQPVPLRAMNITQFAARLQWNLPMETKKLLKAIRVNCTTVKSLIEPYENEEPDIHLYNPSVLGDQIILDNLKPATQYSCKLVGALSLDIGREKLAILSETITFSTLLEEGDNKVYVEEVPRGLSTLHIILGVTIPMVIIGTAIVLMIIGYFTYRKRKRGGGGGRKGKKYRMNVSKNANLPPEDPRPPSPGMKNADKGPRRKSRKSDDKGKGVGKRRATAYPGKAPPPAKKPVVSQKGKKPGGKKPGKKKKGHAIYSELQMNSEEEDNAQRLQGTDVQLAADLGWDPTAYYPHSSNQPPARLPALSKHIDVRGELSSPLMMQHQSGESASGLAPIKHKRKHKHHHSHYKKPLY